MKMTKLMAVMLAFVLVASLFTGCGTDKAASGNTTKTATSKAAGASGSQTAKDPVTISMFIQQNAIDMWGAKLKEQFEGINPDIKIEFNILAEGVDSFNKMDMAVMSGDKTDVVLLQNPNHYSKYVSGKLLMPLNDIAKAANYDMDKVYGGYMKKYENDTVYWLPDAVTMNIVYYNKKIFDDAGVPYPTGNWTWDDYTEIAKKLTDTSKGIYGSLMELDWEYYNYILANQQKASAYKQDGTSNFDDPAWANSLKWLKELSDVHKIQPSRPEFVAKKLQFDSFMTGKFGMEMIGTWFLGIAQDSEKYPRDWKIGVCAPPGNEGGKNILSAGGGFGISNNSKYPNEAFKVIAYLCENEYKENGGVTPARVDVSKEDLLKALASTAEKLNGDVTAEDIYNAAYPAHLGVANEKIIGTASSQINDLYNKEAEKYLFGNQTLEETMKNIKTKADDFIAKEQSAAK